MNPHVPALLRVTGYGVGLMNNPEFPSLAAPSGSVARTFAAPETVARRRIIVAMTCPVTREGHTELAAGSLTHPPRDWIKAKRLRITHSLRCESSGRWVAPRPTKI
jgi:hypothetical protein